MTLFKFLPNNSRKVLVCNDSGANRRKTHVLWVVRVVIASNIWCNVESTVSVLKQICDFLSTARGRNLDLAAVKHSRQFKGTWTLVYTIYYGTTTMPLATGLRTSSVWSMLLTLLVYMPIYRCLLLHSNSINTHKDFK